MASKESAEIKFSFKSIVVNIIYSYGCYILVGDNKVKQYAPGKSSIDVRLELDNPAKLENFNKELMILIEKYTTK